MSTDLRDEAELWRAQWAAEMTRAGEFQRLLREAERARDSARTTCDELTDHCVGQGKRIAELESTVIALTETSEYWKIRSGENYRRADALASWIEEEVKDQDYGFDVMEDLIRAAGVECSECDGHGSVRDEVMIGDPSDKHGYRTRNVVDECDECHGLGRVLR